MIDFANHVSSKHWFNKIFTIKTTYTLCQGSGTFLAKGAIKRTYF